jgi:C-terminal processing protease CtpA/Prc
MKTTRSYLALFPLLLLLLQSGHAQQLEKNIDKSRDNGLKMLRVVKEQIQKNYYDPKFHGVDLNARFTLAAEKIKQATTNGQVLGIIAQVVVDLNDSHTLLIPPLREAVAVYGWQMQMIGDICYMVAVMPGSDAEKKGLKAGDRVISLDGFEPTRDTMWKMKYYYYGLRPKARVQVAFQTTEGETREVEVLTKLVKRKLEVDYGWIVDTDPVSAELGSRKELVPRYEEFGTDLIVWRLASFDIETDEVDKMMKRISGHKSLVLDLRGNPGGRVVTLERFVGYFFDHEVKVGDFKMRKESREIKVKPRKSNVFAGNLTVLVDSQSSSASEIFARIVQLEKRGKVVGDYSSGMVMESLRYQLELETPQTDAPILYGLMITDADIIMTDGKSLECLGVAPDKVIVPTADDIRNHRDPVLAYAASLAGIELDAEKAGKLFTARDPKTKH